MKTLMIIHNMNQMKAKYLFSMICMLALSMTVLTAQETSVFIGGSAGFNRSHFNHTDGLARLYTTNNAVSGMNAGVTAGLQIQNFTVTTGLQFVQKGGVYATENFSDENGTGFFSAKEKLNYLSIPLLVGYRLPFTDQFGVSLAMGPSFNFGIAGEIEESIEYFGSNDVSKDFHTVYFGNGVNEDYKNMQVGFLFTPGLYFRVNDRSTITANITWDLGASDSFNPRYKGANTFFDENNGNQYNRSTMLTLGYEYRFTLEDKY